MKKLMMLFVVMCFSSSSYCYAVAYYFPVIKRMQPDGTVFYGSERASDEEFEWVTLDGYSYTIDPDTKYYHYMTQNAEKNIVVTKYKVGIDDPETHGLVRNIHSRTVTPMNKTYRTPSLGKPAFDNPVSGTISIGVYCIEFNDVAGRCSSNDIENMLFQNTGGTSYTRSDGEANFGSMRDYWTAMSNGNLTVTGEIVNKDGSGNIEWLYVDEKKDTLNANYCNQFDSLVVHYYMPLAKAYHTAKYGNDDLWATHDVVCFIYAGNLYDRAGGGFAGLCPHGSDDKNYYVMSELTDNNPDTNFRNAESSPDSVVEIGMAHIGTHCHEFGHVLKFAHPQQQASVWDLMMNGNTNGSRVGNCPAPVNPIYRAWQGWITLTEVNETTTNLTVANGLTHAYKVKSHNTSRPYDVFVLEHYEPEGFRRYIWQLDLSGESTGMLVWYNNGISYQGPSLMRADQYTQYFPDVSHPTQQLKDQFKDDYLSDLFPGNDSVTTFSGSTTPSIDYRWYIVGHTSDQWNQYSEYVGPTYILLKNIAYSSVNKNTTLEYYYNNREGTVTNAT